MKRGLKRLDELVREGFTLDDALIILNQEEPPPDVVVFSCTDGTKRLR